MGIIKSTKSIIRKNSAGSDFIRRRVNLIEGSGITLTVADDSANNEIDVTIAGGASGASTALDNLASVAINTSLISDTDSTDDLGSTTKFWANAYIDKIFFNSYLYATPSESLVLDLGSNFASGGFTLNLIAGSGYHATISYSTISGSSNFILQRGNSRITIGNGFLEFAAPNGVYPDGDSTTNLGITSRYWLATYTDKLFLNATATIDGAAAGHLKFVGDLVPNTDDTEWIGQLETPFKAIKGLIIKDTTDGKHYKVTVVSGVLTTTALD